MLSIIRYAHGAEHFNTYTKATYVNQLPLILIELCFPSYVLKVPCQSLCGLDRQLVAPSFRSICMDCVMCLFDVVSICKFNLKSELFYQKLT